MLVSSVLFGASILLPWLVSSMRADQLKQLRQDTVRVFYHGFSNYMKHAFPEDELRPLSCTPLTRDRENPANVGLNDVLGNYSLTLIDSLSTLAILAGGPQTGPYTGPHALQDFQQSVAEFVRYYGDGRDGPSGQGIRAKGFDLDSKVQVFETVIRGVGGLLSAHLFAIGELPITGYDPKRSETSDEGNPLELTPIRWSDNFQYDGQLLRLALDLAQRLLPAFYTKTGIPYPRVNLRHGIPFYPNSPLHRKGAGEFADAETEPSREITETCSAGAGSLVLEFVVLSRLTGDTRFEQAAKRAFWAIWQQRSSIGLIGSGIDAERGTWIGGASGIGAGIDSFFEYALKTHILLSGHDLPNITTRGPKDKRRGRRWLDPDALHPPLTPEENSADTFLRAWHDAHAAIKRYLYNGFQHPLHDFHHPSYVNGNRETGAIVALWIDSLGAFYPGLLALAGELEEAVEANLLYTALWTRFSALPERWSVGDSQVESNIGWWPGRPEFIESTYHLYRATRDPWYLYVGEMVMKDIMRRCYTDCGWSGLQDVRTGEKSDRMESFFLGETTKYMYLLFDPDHPLNKLDAAYVFTTEGHPLIIPRKKSPATPRREKDYSHSPKAYYNSNYTNECPAPPEPFPLTGSATAARSDIFHAAGLTGLHLTPNSHGKLETAGVEETENGPVTLLRPSTNHTFYPWTLPPAMLPANGTCHRLLADRVTTIEFPSSVRQSSDFEKFFPQLSVERISGEGLFIKTIDKLKLQLSIEENLEGGDLPLTWRLKSINGIPLGRDEYAAINFELVAEIRDPLFDVIRDPSIVDIVVDYDDHSESALSDANATDADGRFMSAYRSAVKTVKDQLSSVFTVLQSAETNPPQPASVSSTSSTSRLRSATFLASTPVGVGAIPVPDTPLAPIPNPADPTSPMHLPWETIYAAGDGCAGPLPPNVPRTHRVIIFRRGGCTFSEKLANIPNFFPGDGALALVLVVDESADPMLVRPSLDEDQNTPSGLPRYNPVAMALVRGGYEGIYEMFRNAKRIGLRRRYHVESRGLQIQNLRVR